MTQITTPRDRTLRGLRLSEIGFGTAPLGNMYCRISDSEAQATLEKAWDGGIRYFDTAPLYGFGLSETRLNRFLRGKPRDSYVLSTKVGRLLKPCAPGEIPDRGEWFDVPHRKEIFDYSYDGVMRSVEFSYERLGLSRIDILFVHDLCAFTHGSRSASDLRIREFFDKGGYDAMRTLRDQGVVSAIGGGVNEWEVCETLAMRGDFDMFLLAGRYTLLEQEALNSFLPLCEERGIGIITGGPFNSGILASGAVAGAYYNYEPAPAAILERVAATEAVCQEFGVSLKAAALQFPLLHPAHVSVIPGGQSAAEIEDNLAAYSEDIPPELWRTLKEKGILRSDAPTDKPGT